MQDEYLEVNPAGQVPAMKETNLETGKVFVLAESHAIMRYLAESRKTMDHWYPRNLRERAKVN